MDTKEIATMKDAARRLQDFLAAKNVKVSHTMALEALTASLGSRNWRTLRDKLSEPGKAAAPTLEELGGCLWAVRGAYSNDGGLFGDYHAGATPLEAAVMAVYERLSEREFLTVHEVENRMTGDLDDGMSVSYSSMLSHSKALQAIVAHGRSILPDFSTLPRTEEAEDDWYVGNAVLEIFEKVLASPKFVENLDIFHKFMPRLGQDVDGVLGFEDSKGKWWTEPVPVFLNTLVQRADAFELKTPELEQARYQLRAMSAYFEDKLCRLIANELIYG